MKCEPSDTLNCKSAQLGDGVTKTWHSYFALLYVHSFEKDEITMIKHTPNVQFEKERESVRTDLVYWVFWHSSPGSAASRRVGNALKSSDLSQLCVGCVQNEDTLECLRQNGT